MKTITSIILICVFMLTACTGSETEQSPTAALKGKLVLGITDAPVDSAAKVVVKFTGIELKPANGDSISYTFGTPKEIDLLALQGGGSELLLDEVTVDSGVYNWIRLNVEAESNILDSYLEELDGTQVSLWIPSGSQTGLKLNDSFVITESNISDFTIDFDLRKSITNPPGQVDYFLKPRLRLIDNNMAGELSGTVDESLINAEGCSDTAAVYVFSSDVAPEDVDDIDLSDDENTDLGGADPITAASVELAQDGIYEYTAAFLTADDYTIALTCQSGFDDSNIDNDDVNTNGGQTVSFIEIAQITVTANTTTTHDFIATP